MVQKCGKKLPACLRRLEILDIVFDVIWQFFFSSALEADSGPAASVTVLITHHLVTGHTKAWHTELLKGQRYARHGFKAGET